MAMKGNPVIWFELPVKDMSRAKKFYETVFGIALGPPMEVGDSTLSFFPMQMDAVGAGGALIRNSRCEPSVQGTTVYFSVESIDPVLDRIKAAGGSTCMGRTSIGQYGFMAHFQDTEGNRVALHEVVRM
jgi:uncharacterized protein